MGPRKDASRAAASAEAALTARASSSPTKGAASAAREQKEEPIDESPAWEAPPPGAAQQQRARASLALNRAVVNIFFHTLLMFVVPFALFFSVTYGALDPLFTYTGAKVPARDTKSILGAVLAVVSINLVIASFLITAFSEKDEEPLKED